jgi:hypothetical protein
MHNKQEAATASKVVSLKELGAPTSVGVQLILGTGLNHA